MDHYHIQPVSSSGMTVATLDEAVRPATADLPVHVSPPISARLLVLASPRASSRCWVLFCVLAITAHFDGGRLLLFVDRPVERFVIAHRSPRLDWVFNHLSFLAAPKSC